MAIFHSHVQIISRGKGKSAVAAAAYRAAQTITNEYDGVTHDYTSKRGIVHTEIMLPGHVSAEYADRAVLWNAVEKIERSKHAQLAREIELALPVELTREQNIALVREYVQRHFVNAGMCVDLCVHDSDGTNPHAHILLTMRPINENGTWGDKQRKEYILDGNGDKIYDPKKKQYKCKSIPTTDWNEQNKAEIWRAGWTAAVNAVLRQNGVKSRIDHRSFARQGLEQVPTVHMGVSAMQMERKGIRTERGNQNREVAVSNSQIRQLRTRINKVKGWLYSQPLTDAPTMSDMMSAVNRAQNMKSQWQKIRTLQRAAQVLIFVQQNGIGGVEQLADKVTELHQRQYNLTNSIKAKERRLSTLKKHLAQVELYNQHRAVYRKYKSLDPKKRGAYAEKYADEIEQYKSAMTYLKEHLNGHTTIPEKEWEAEQKDLLADRYALVEGYYKLEDDVKNAEALRRGAENMMREVTPERTAVGSLCVEL